MNNMSVAQKLIVSFGLVIVLFVAFGIYASNSGMSLADNTREVHSWQTQTAVDSHLSDGFNAARIAGLRYNYSEDPATQAKILDEIKEANVHVDEGFKQYEKMIADAKYDTEEERKSDVDAMNHLKSLWKDYVAVGGRVRGLLANGQADEAHALADGEGTAKFEELKKAMLADEEKAVRGANDAYERSIETASTVQLVTIVSLVVVILATVLALFFLLRYIKSSVSEVLTAATAVADGDLRVKVNIDSTDEFGQIAEKFNAMVGNVNKMTRQIQDTAVEVSNSSTTLSETSEQSAQATQNVAQSITEVAGAAQSQMDSINSTGEMIAKLDEGIRQTSRNIEQALAQIQETTKAAQEGNVLVNTTVNQMESLTESVAKTSEMVSKLGERSKEIGNIVEVIAGISGQTNLLALNAAIEAARAGEQGRGFAVVAEEVRKLAEESSNAAQQISDLIRNIQTETEAAVVAMEGGRSEVEQGRENVIATGEGFGKIRSMIEAVEDGAKEITKTMNELTKGIVEIVDSSAMITDAAKRVAGESETVSAATEEQAAGMEEIAASSHSLSDLAEQLRGTVSKFKL